MTISLAAIPERIKKLSGSLFGRLFLISAIAALLMLLVMAITLRDIQVHSPSNQISYQLLSIHFSEAPPTPTKLHQFETETGWTLITTGPDFLWPETASSEMVNHLKQEAQDTDFGFFWLGKQRWLVFRNQGYNYFATTFQLEFSPEFKLIIARGLGLLLLISVLSYLMTRWLFMPISTLKSGADRIASGDLDYRLPTERKDELGAVNSSVNAMANRLRLAVDEKRQLLLAMGHELRTPLTRIKLLLEMLPQGQDRDQIARNLDDINQLVVTLLDAEALSGGFMALQRTATDVKQLVENCCANFDHPMVLTMPEPLPQVMLDQSRLQIVLRNLLNNAVKYGGEKITIAAKCDDAFLYITVSDDGQGIEEDILKQLGQPFYRPDSARSRKTGGHGLGLYLSRIIIESHGGKLQIASQIKQGTDINIELPCEPTTTDAK